MPAATMFSSSACIVQPDELIAGLAAAVGADADLHAGRRQQPDAAREAIPRGGRLLGGVRRLRGEPILEPLDLRRRHRFRESADAAG